jgi:hypothetical protein
MYLEVPATPDVLCSVHSKITWILLLCHLAILRLGLFNKPLRLCFSKLQQFHFINCFTVDAATLRVIHLSSSEDKKRFSLSSQKIFS